MRVALCLYEQWTETGEVRPRAKAVADIFEHIHSYSKPIAIHVLMVAYSKLQLMRKMRDVSSLIRNTIEEVGLALKEIEGRV